MLTFLSLASVTVSRDFQKSWKFSSSWSPCNALMRIVFVFVSPLICALKSGKFSIFRLKSSFSESANEQMLLKGRWVVVVSEDRSVQAHVGEKTRVWNGGINYFNGIRLTCQVSLSGWFSPMNFFNLFSSVSTQANCRKAASSFAFSRLPE